MAVRQRRYSKEELAGRGQELYESGIRQQVEAGNDGKIVAIDIETGEFEVDDTVMGATVGIASRKRIGYLNANLMLNLGRCGLDTVPFTILDRGV